MRAPEFWRARSGPMAGPKARIIAGLLAPLGAAWDAASRLRRAMARPYRAPIPVICVGNLVAGGAGKTPVVLALASMIRERHDVHVVTRGYGGLLAGPVVDRGLRTVLGGAQSRRRGARSGCGRRRGHRAR
jgi:tetraacyldisaccharide 4'-kinase